MSNNISMAFEGSFLRVPFEVQVQACERYELASTILDLFKDHQPVIEAGCGSGRWVAWLRRRGIVCDGIDWSRALCEQARIKVPEARFFEGDVRKMPVLDASYGGVLSLGTVEHVTEGPQTGILEFRRVLRERGMLLLTVPYGGWFRRVRVRFGLLVKLCQNRAATQEADGKKTPLAMAVAGTTYRWCPRFMRSEQGWEFFEYEFSKRQMRQFLQNCGFEVLTEEVGFVDEGLSHNIGLLAGHWNEGRQDVTLTAAGRLLKKVLPRTWVGHMLCYVARKQ